MNNSFHCGSNDQTVIRPILIVSHCRLEKKNILSDIPEDTGSQESVNFDLLNPITGFALEDRENFKKDITFHISAVQSIETPLNQECLSTTELESIISLFFNCKKKNIEIDQRVGNRGDLFNIIVSLKRVQICFKKIRDY